MKRFSFNAKVLLAVSLASILCTGAAVLNSMHVLHDEGVQALVEKSRAVLSRLKVGAGYVAQMDTLDGVIQETVQKFPDGNLPKNQIEKILRSVPIYAAFQIGKQGAKEEHYEFRVAAKNPRNPDNKATLDEEEIIERFKADSGLKEIIEITKDNNYVKVTRPVHLNKDHKCLTCHGDSSESPWKNGKDILGFNLEGMKDGDLKGIFTIISDLRPVQAKANTAAIQITIWGLLFTCVALLIGYLVVRGSIKSLTTAVKELSNSSDELSQASSQITKVSEALSASSAESASALQETVASTEELSSMVKLNSEHAKQAATLSQTSTTEAEQGEKEIRDLIAAMKEISESSKKIEEIINVIDDIAFQTNLLALNAAVEAARAGEQGKGFAVVADAVRGLAQRSATAAKDITDLIRGSVDKISRGEKAADTSGVVLKNIVGSIKKVSDLNAEIASASVEQSNGISQISKAMTELDNSTQSNAASSQETSASAEQMTAQAEQLNKLVKEMMGVVYGKSKTPLVEKAEQYNTIPFPKTKFKNRRQNSSLETPSEVIPFDDEASVKGKVGTTDGF